MTSLSRNMSSVVVVGTALCEHRRTNRSTARQTPGPSCLPAPESTRLSGGGGGGGLCSHPRDVNEPSTSARHHGAASPSDSSWKKSQELWFSGVGAARAEALPIHAQLRRTSADGLHRAPGASQSSTCCRWYGTRTALESAQSLAASNSGGPTGCSSQGTIIFTYSPTLSPR